MHFSELVLYYKVTYHKGWDRVWGWKNNRGRWGVHHFLIEYCFQAYPNCSGFKLIIGYVLWSILCLQFKTTLYFYEIKGGESFNVLNYLYNMNLFKMLFLTIISSDQMAVMQVHSCILIYQHLVCYKCAHLFTLW